MAAVSIHLKDGITVRHTKQQVEMRMYGGDTVIYLDPEEAAGLALDLLDAVDLDEAAYEAVKKALKR